MPALYRLEAPGGEVSGSGTVPVKERGFPRQRPAFPAAPEKVSNAKIQAFCCCSELVNSKWERW